SLQPIVATIDPVLEHRPGPWGEPAFEPLFRPWGRSIGIERDRPRMAGCCMQDFMRKIRSGEGYHFSFPTLAATTAREPGMRSTGSDGQSRWRGTARHS